MSDSYSKFFEPVLFAMLLEKVLYSVDIPVIKETLWISKPPKIDLLVLKKREPGQWTDEQLARLPDGIRETYASDILLEFKPTESLNENTFQQALAFNFFYKRVQGLTDEQVQTFIVSAKQPQARRLSQWGYVKTELKGVYHNPDNWLLPKIALLSLNELSNEPHNAWIKCFASRKIEKKRALQILRRTDFGNPFVIMLERVFAEL